MTMTMTIKMMMMTLAMMMAMLIKMTIMIIINITMVIMMANISQYKAMQTARKECLLTTVSNGLVHDTSGEIVLNNCRVSFKQ